MYSINRKKQYEYTYSTGESKQHQENWLETKEGDSDGEEGVCRAKRGRVFLPCLRQG